MTAEEVASSTVYLSEVNILGSRVCWLETRPYEGGRSVPVRLNPDGSQEDLISEGFNARSRVHEYGGGSYLVQGKTVYFSNFEDQRLYRYEPGSQPTPLTLKKELCFADFRTDEARGKGLISVCADYTAGPLTWPLRTSSTGSGRKKTWLGH